jgi:hypothetical protein
VLEATRQPRRRNYVTFSRDPRAPGFWSSAQRDRTLWDGRAEVLVGSASCDLLLRATVDVGGESP